MFFKFDSKTQRISRSGPSEAYKPQGMSQTSSPSSSEFRFDSAKTNAVKTSTGTGSMVAESASGVGPRGVVPSGSRYQSVMRMQHKFAAQDGLLVWQKLGGRDTMPYYVTLGLMGVGTIWALKTLWTMSWPRKQE